MDLWLLFVPALFWLAFLMALLVPVTYVALGCGLWYGGRFVAAKARETYASLRQPKET